MERIENKKLDSIIETAGKLFWHHGYKRITVEEICKKAGVSKMTFYKHFRNKSEIATFIMRNIFNDAIGNYRQIMETKIPYVEKVKRIILMKMEKSHGLSQEFLNDMHNGEVPEIKELMEKFMEQTRNFVYEDFIHAQKAGYIRKGINPRFLVYMMNKLVEISTDENISGFYKSPQHMIQEFVNFFYFGIMPINNHEINNT